MRPGVRSGAILPVMRAAYAVMVAFALWLALAPAKALGSHEVVAPWDKALHFTGLWGLSLGAAVAFPRAHLLGLAILMVGFGGMIEVLQGLPVSGRDPDFADWLADTIGVAAAYLPLIAAGWRQGLLGEVFQPFGDGRPGRARR